MRRVLEDVWKVKKSSSNNNFSVDKNATAFEYLKKQVRSPQMESAIAYYAIILGLQRTLKMKAYEFPPKITPEGTLKVPEERLDSFPDDQVVRVIVLVNEPVEGEEADDNALEFSAESFRQSWHEAITGRTLPLSQLCPGIEVD